MPSKPSADSLRAASIGVCAATALVTMVPRAAAQVTLPRIPEREVAGAHDEVLLELQGVRFRQGDIDAINQAVQNPRLHALSDATVQRLTGFEIGPLGECRYTFSRTGASGSREVFAIQHAAADRNDTRLRVSNARAGSYLGLGGYEIPSSTSGADRFVVAAAGGARQTKVEYGKVMAVGPSVALFASKTMRGMIIDRTVRVFFERESSQSCKPGRERCRRLFGPAHLAEYEGRSLRDQRRVTPIGTIELEVQCGGHRHDVMPDMDLFSLIRRLFTTLPH